MGDIWANQSSKINYMSGRRGSEPNVDYVQNPDNYQCWSHKTSKLEWCINNPRPNIQEMEQF